MRMLMKWSPGTREASEAIRSGRMADISETIDELAKPEAQYFCTEDGTRTGYVFFDLADPSDIPRSQSHCSKTSTQRSNSFESSDLDSAVTQ